MSIAMMPVVDEHIQTDLPSAEYSPASDAVQTGTTTGFEQDGHTMTATVTPHGRLRIENLPAIDRNFALAIHLAPFAAFILPAAVLGIVAPIVLWLIRKDRSTFVDDHGREMLNFLLSLIIVPALMIVSCVVIITIPVVMIALPVFLIAGMVNMIRGAIAASSGEYFRYPLTIRLVN
jgi:uncharacterized Tic20 family protein